MALFGHRAMSDLSPLSGVKRNHMLALSFSGFDPTETSIGAKQSPPLMLTPVNPRGFGRTMPCPALGNRA
jgi:hypothetical protein